MGNGAKATANYLWKSSKKSCRIFWSAPEDEGGPITTRIIKQNSVYAPVILTRREEFLTRNIATVTIQVPFLNCRVSLLNLRISFSTWTRFKPNPNQERILKPETSSDVVALMALMFILDVGFVMFFWDCGQPFTTRDHGTHVQYYELTWLFLWVSPVTRVIVPLQVLSGPPGRGDNALWLWSSPLEFESSPIRTRNAYLKREHVF